MKPKPQVSMVKVSAPGPYKKYKQQRGGPPQNIFSLAAAMPADVDYEMIDETIGMTFQVKNAAPLVFLMMSTADAPRAYQLADDLRAIGHSVVFGGLHATFLPDEALQHGHAVMEGESESVIAQVLADHNSGNLAKRYAAESPPDLACVNPYPTRKILPAQYDGFWSVLVSRGCPMRCSFCLVHEFFPQFSYRPVAAVIDEIRNCGANWVELHADNLTHDRDYALELFTALRPLNINWVGETTITIAKDDELLRAAADSGLRYLLVGLETPSKAALKQVAKGFVKPEQAREYVGRLHEYNIMVDSAMLFGFDDHDASIFEEALEFSEYVGIDICDGIISIPFPGSKLYHKLEQEQRILTRDWSQYDGAHAVFQPAKMSPQELEDGAAWFWKKQYSPNRFLRRKWRHVKNVGLGNAMYLWSR